MILKKTKKILRKLSLFLGLRKEKIVFDDYWVQKVNVTRKPSRIAYFDEICNNKSVLHFGCTDWPIFNKDSNLHIILSKNTKSIDGFDIDIEGLENLKKYVKGDYFSKFQDVSKQYEVCLVPETIEHVDNVKDFLTNLSTVKADYFLITAPNCFATEHMTRNISTEDYFEEIVHPDHNCWYSPFTLKNQIEKYSDLKVVKVVLLEGDRMICCEATKK